MTDQDKNTSLPAPSGEAAGVTLPRRRRLLTGTTAGAGVLLAMQAKTALGTGVTCQSPSAMISGNHSPRTGNGHQCSGGRSPGFWVNPQHFPYWMGISYPTFNNGIVVCSSGTGNVSPCDISAPGTTIGSIFTGAPNGQLSVWEVLQWPTNYPTYSGANCTGTKTMTDKFNGKGQLLRHLSSAYLNAMYFSSTSQDYPLSTLQIVAMWDAVKDGGTYCPAGMVCNGNAMSAAQIIAYIEGMYDINSAVPNLCKAP